MASEQVVTGMWEDSVARIILLDDVHSCLIGGQEPIFGESTCSRRQIVVHCDRVPGTVCVSAGMTNLNAEQPLYEC